MTTILLALTIDVDPDGLSGTTVNRRALSWGSLARVDELFDVLDDIGARIDARIPITWFVRADGQLRDAFGGCGWLLENQRKLWVTAARRGDELGWHPHLYRCGDDDEPELITSPSAAVDEIERLWNELADYDFFKPVSFRNGEGWHCPETFAAVERLGFEFDSTAIPGRRAAAPHPMDWTDSPNRPYYPSATNLRRAGAARDLLEMPLNTWKIQAPYDAAPRVRYINPAIHEQLFEAGLESWEAAQRGSQDDVQAWVLVLHPDDALVSSNDQLYARSPRAMGENLARFYRRAARIADRVEFTTLSRAGRRWKAPLGTTA